MRSISRALPLALVLGLLCTLAAVLSAPAQGSLARPAGAFSARLAISTSSIDVTKPVVLSGTVKPAARGIVVKLQKRLEGKERWVNEATVKTKADGRFSYTDKPTTAGKRSYRVIVPATANRDQGVSKSVGLTVFRWQDLTKVKVRDASATGVELGASIGGTTYPRSWVGGTYANGGFVDWNFAKRCTGLKARFGNGDESDDNATASVELVIDGVSAYAETFGLTEKTDKVFDVTGAFRVAFKWSSDNPDVSPPNRSGAQAMMASPLVRCSF